VCVESAQADEFDREPIRYSTARANNVVSRLQERLDAGAAALKFENDHGYLRSFLQALDVPASSQMLVFSKTSLQRERITPKTPRALYFNDDVYVGFCQQGAVLEISAVDPNLGTVFYTLDQEPVARPKLTRQTDNCLQCHGSTQTRGVPGHLVRSVFADRSGQPILSMGGFRVDQTTPFGQRWGGWYVTGTHGSQKHLGNLIVRGQREPEEIDNAAGQNVISLQDRLTIGSYLTPHSDVVALLVLEHQTEMHNLIAKANLQTRVALHEEAELNRELGRGADYRSETTWRRIRSIGDPLVKYLFFSKEAPLTEKVQGTSSFAADFAKEGPRDPKGRSLRDFDLQKRLFKYPCSYLIYTKAFDALPETVKSYVYGRMHDVLTGRDYTRDFDHLNADDRQAIREILLATKPELAAAWREN
jgi:hypothetical protein